MRLKTFGLGAVALAAISVACSDTFPTLSSTAAKEDFSAVLAPTNEVPAVTGTSASGTFSMTFENENTIRYIVQVATIDSVTQSHIHAGAAGANGPIMVFLYGPSTTNLGRLSGVLRQSDIIKGGTYTPPFNFDSVAARIRAGTAYVNVHTRLNPAGEIRGQIVP